MQPIADPLLPYFNHDPAALNAALQPVFIAEVEGEDVYVPQWHLSQPELRGKLTVAELTLLGLLFIDMRLDVADLMTNLYAVNPLDEEADSLPVAIPVHQAATHS